MGDRVRRGVTAIVTVAHAHVPQPCAREGVREGAQHLWRVAIVSVQYSPRMAILHILAYSDFL